jgi:hypothetical protein
MSHMHFVHIPLAYPKISDLELNADIDGLLEGFGQVRYRQSLPQKLFGLGCEFDGLRVAPTVREAEVIALRSGFAVDKAYHTIAIGLQVEEAIRMLPVANPTFFVVIDAIRECSPKEVERSMGKRSRF